MTYHYCISNGPGRLVAEGFADTEGQAGEVLDTFTVTKKYELRKDAKDGFSFVGTGDDYTVQRRSGIWSMTALYVGEHPPN